MRVPKNQGFVLGEPQIKAKRAPVKGIASRPTDGLHCRGSRKLVRDGCMSQQSEAVSLKPFVGVGIAFGVCIGAFVAFMKDSVSDGIEVGLMGGSMFGVAMHRFVMRLMTTTTLEVDGQAAEFEPSEELLHVGPASHFKGVEVVGGKLFLTTHRLRFRSHKMNVQNHDSSYPLSSLRAVEPCRTFGIVPNGLLVHLRDGSAERFVVHGRARWLDLLKQRIDGR